MTPLYASVFFRLAFNTIDWIGFFRHRLCYGRFAGRSISPTTCANSSTSSAQRLFWCVIEFLCKLEHWGLHNAYRLAFSPDDVL